MPLQQNCLNGLAFVALKHVFDFSRRDYLQVDEQDPFLPPTAASQAIAARTLRNQGSFATTYYSHYDYHFPPPPYPAPLPVATYDPLDPHRYTLHEHGMTATLPR